MEDLDLLIKWLGPDSTKQATSIRASNIHNPLNGLQRIWERLDDRYGSPEIVESALLNKLTHFPKLSPKDNTKLYELSDIVSEIECVKENPKYKQILAYFDSSSGVRQIIEKLPFNLQEKWTAQAIKYKKAFGVPYPPFAHFAEFIRETSKDRNDPSFFLSQVTHPSLSRKFNISTRKTETMETIPKTKCPLHKSNHSLNQCISFRAKPIHERKELIRKFGYCYKCCTTDQHFVKDCQVKSTCLLCKGDHPSALHVKTRLPYKREQETQGGEEQTHVKSNCTKVCGSFQGKSCAKTLLVNVFHQDRPQEKVKLYTILDDQSNSSLGTTELFDKLCINGDKVPYSLSSCAGTAQTSGRRTSGIVVETLDGSTSLQLQTLVECNDIPDIRNEIATPQVAANYLHLKDIEHFLAPLDNIAKISLLIGRDLIEAHHVLDQKIGPRNTPFAQKLPLGWVVIGEACLSKTHYSQHVNVAKTQILPNGRPTILEPCPNQFHVKYISPNSTSKHSHTNFDLGVSIFQTTPQDDNIAMSQEDRKFINLMETMHKSKTGNWIAPLPFRQPRTILPNNRNQALKRAMALKSNLLRKEERKTHFCAFMQKMLDKGHAEVAPTPVAGKEYWYLPIFGVYHPKKKDEIRVVFDSSAKFNGVSLNDVLMTGPDLTNNLLGILLKFRREKVAINVDIEQMFYSFFVKEEHRDFIRFLWHQENDLSKPLIDYNMCVHVFGNNPSPAIATYGLRKAAQLGAVEYGADTVDFVANNFYVDDGVTSLPSSEAAIDLVRRTQKSLMENGALRLHKIVSNDIDVMKAFNSEDLAKNLRNIELGTDSLPLQRSLGLLWNLESDTFTFKVSNTNKPYTRRGLLSTVNSLFDPLGFTAPVTIQGKLFLRNLLPNTTDWDEPLPPEFESTWNKWKQSLTCLESLNIQRTYSHLSFTDIRPKDIHVFCDASETAIAAAAYLKITEGAKTKWSFILGKAKVAPLNAHTIPRLELCAATLAVEISDFLQEHLNLHTGDFTFFSDSKIVLGYIHNETRRFSVYVANRINIIRRSTNPAQWLFVLTSSNPADAATRPIDIQSLPSSPWLKGPSETPELSESTYDLVDPENDAAVKPITTLSTVMKQGTSLGTKRFERFSSWKSLVRGIAILKHVVQNFNGIGCNGWHFSGKCLTTDLYKEVENVIIKAVQQDTYHQEIEDIRKASPILKTSPIIALNPFLDEQGILRVGGRLLESGLDFQMKHPIILPGHHYISTLLVRHFHHSVHHQGRHITEGALRAGGYWITGGKRLISTILHQCVTCRKLRGKPHAQVMADLPLDRLTPAPPFSYVGVDVFGPWSVISRKTRGGQANSKRWAVLFTCLSTRAIHLEAIEEMSSSSFINSLRRFTSIRGDVIQFRSDRGTNFIGAAEELKMNCINVESGPTKDFLLNKKTTWVFNTPHSSHMGGAWERLIGVTRKILDCMLMESSGKLLTHEVLSTFLAEASAIVNSRPIVSVSSDPEHPEILTPATLLTQKTCQPKAPLGDWDTKSLYKAQWRRVQSMSETFWKRWQSQYLSTLQRRTKWQTEKENIKEDDIILLKYDDNRRYQWPTGIVLRTFPSKDGKVRKAEVRIIKEGQPAVYTRPTTDMILLLSP